MLTVLSQFHLELFNIPESTVRNKELKTKGNLSLGKISQKADLYEE
jgi:hypothetical protein